MSKQPPYGKELILDLHDCDASRFTRRHLRTFFKGLCAIIDMDPEDLHFWDDTGVNPEKRQTDPRTKGTSAVQFILMSSIVVHTLDIPRSVYINLFSCKDFDTYAATIYCLQFFSAETHTSHLIERT